MTSAAARPSEMAATTAGFEHKATAYGSLTYRWYVVGLLTLVYACNAMDRALPSVLVEPIRQEFRLSDVQLGLITGTGYGLAVALAVIPMGMLSDRLNRRTFLGLVVIAWSLCTALAGGAKTVTHLMLARFGVGIAQAGAVPAAVPMLSDIFPAGQRSFAFGVFFMGSNLGAFIATALGGYVAAAYGWRAAFLAVGLPGLLIGLLFILTVREPQRGGLEADEPNVGDAPSFRSALAYLVRTPGLLCLAVGGALGGLISITVGVWIGSFFIRVHGLGLVQVGLILGLGGGLCSVFSPPLAGWLADRLSVRDPRWTLRIVSMSLVGAFCAGMLMLFAPAVAVAIAAYVIADFLNSGNTALTCSVLMTECPARMRGTIMSLVQMLSIFLGFGAGPLIIGYLSDLHGGGESIRYALRDSQLLFVVVIALYLAASRLLYSSKPAAA